MPPTLRDLVEELPGTMQYTESDLLSIERRSPEATARQQGLFNRVWQHFVVEKKPFGLNPQGCVFRNKEGYPCAVGLFIPNARYTPGLEGASPLGLIHLGVLVGPTAEDIVLLNALQDAHDNAAESPSDGGIETRLRAKAQLHRLTIPN
jgi:hypothetical protein